MIRAGYRVVDQALRLTCNEIWNVGLVEQSVEDIIAHGIKGRVRWWPDPPKGTILADPSWQLREGDAGTVFAEFMDVTTAKGEIWSAEVETGADPTSIRFEPSITESFHMSYPTPLVDDDGRHLLTAETFPSPHTYSWRKDGGRWKRSSILFPDRAAVDPTFWYANDRWWLFCTFREEGDNNRLFAFHAPRIDGPWTPHKRNPIKCDYASARPAGPIFKVGSLVVRPGQDCSRTYGGAVILHELLRLDEREFEERPIRRLDPVPGRYCAGLHTFCKIRNFTLIDGKAWRPEPSQIIGKIRRRIFDGRDIFLRRKVAEPVNVVSIP